MEHSLHIASKHFVEAMAPVSPISIRKKVKAALVMARNNGELDLDEFDKALSAIDLENVGDQGDGDSDGDGNGDGDGADGDDDDFTPGDSLGKALALVKQVQYYPLCIITPTNPVFRSGCPPRQEHFSNHHAFRLGSNPSSFFSGSAPDGRRSIIFLIDCCRYERYCGLQTTPPCLQHPAGCRSICSPG
jgi:hypothetical protein